VISSFKIAYIRMIFNVKSLIRSIETNELTYVIDICIMTSDK